MILLRADALLFDNDGVLVDSFASVDDAWTTWCHHWDLDPDEILPQVHGRPSGQTVSRLITESRRDEALQMIDRLELDTADEVRALPGAVDLLESLVPGTWAIVTSGTDLLARARLRAAGIPLPDVVITADDVSHGKPDPEPYVTGATRLGRAPAHCLVFEDAPAGVQAARAAGVRHVVGVTNRHPGTDAFATDLRAVAVHADEVRISEP